MAFPDGFGRRCALVIQSDQVTDNETDFPVLITEDTLPSEIFDADGSYPALNGGGDIRFSSDEAGDTQLACEIEKFVTDNDPANGKAAIWVKVPSLSSSTNTTIYIWYHKSGESQPAEDNAYGKENVWDSNFVMVQHMNQIPDGTAGEIVDSTSNDNDGTTSGMDSADQVAGQIDGSLDFDGGDDNVDLPYSAIYELPLNDGGFTISQWVNPDLLTAIVNFDAAFALGGTDDFLIYPNEGIAGSGVRIFWRDLGGNIFVETGQDRTGVFFYLVFTSFGGNNHRIYADGQEIGSSSATGAEGPFNSARIGGWADASQYFNGIIDEVRISNTARSAGWIATEYNNQYAPGTFLIEGTPETPEAGVTLIVAELTSSSTLDNVSLTQKHILAVQALLSEGTLDNVSLTQKHILAVQELLSSGVLDDLALTQKHLLVVQELLSAGAIDNIELLVATLLTVSDMLSIGAIDNTALTQKHILSIDEVLSAGQIDGLALTQKHLLIIDSLISSGVIDNIRFDIAAGLIYISLSDVTEYNISLSDVTEYNISLSDVTEYNISLSEAGGGLQ